MSDPKKLSELSAISSLDGDDYFPVIDDSEATLSAKNKVATLTLLIAFLQEQLNFATGREAASNAEAVAGTEVGIRDWSPLRIKQAIDEHIVSLPDTVTQGEAEAGTVTDVRLWSPERVKQAIDALANELPDTVTQAAAEAGSSTTAYLWTPQRVRQAIEQLAPGGTGEQNPDSVSQAEAEAGTVTADRLWSPERVKQAIEALGVTLPATVSQAVAEAGTSTTAFLWTPERVKQAIVELAPGGSGEENPDDASQAEAEAGTETANRSWSPVRVKQAIDALSEDNPDDASQAEAEAGTETANRSWSPVRVKQAIAALAPSVGAAESIILSATQSSHGFAVGDYAEYQTDGSWDDSLSEKNAVRGIVTAVDGDDIEVTIFGIVTGLTIGGTAETFGDPVYASTSSQLTTSFTGFEMGTALATGELFVNPRYWPIGSIIQDYGETIVPSSAQTLTTTFADVTDAFKTWVPKGGASKTEVVVELDVLYAVETTSDDLGFHLRLLKDAVECTKSQATQFVFTIADGVIQYVHGQASWGQGVSDVLKVQAREYSASYDTKLFETRLADGATGSELKNAYFRVYERRVA